MSHQSNDKKIVTFGEVMLRLCPPDFQRLGQARSLEMTWGGAEANVAVALAHLGRRTTFVTRLPNNDMAQACVNELRGLGVDTSHILRGGERVGVYYVEKGAAQRASTVLYDRAHSAISEIDPAELDWDAIFGDDTAAFHFTGITPALSPTCTKAARDGAAAAKKKGVLVTCDLNFRNKLWTREQARRTMGDLMTLVDICVANEEDAESVFDIRAHGADVVAGKLESARYIEVADKIIQQFGCRGVAFTLRESFSASRNGWSGLLHESGRTFVSARYEIDIVDRVGGGDAFAAGLIFGLTNNLSGQETIEFAAATGCLKHSIPGDYCRVSRREVETLVKGDGSGRVQR